MTNHELEASLKGIRNKEADELRFRGLVVKDYPSRRQDLVIAILGCRDVEELLKEFVSSELSSGDVSKLLDMLEGRRKGGESSDYYELRVRAVDLVSDALVQMTGESTEDCQGQE